MKRLAAAAVLGAALFAAPSPAPAQVVGNGFVWCLNCSQEVADSIRWAQSLLNQVQEIEQQIQTVQWLVQNTISLPARLISDITSPIYQAEALVRQAEMLGQQTKFMLSNLSGQGYGGYGGSLDDIPRALQQENIAISNAMQQLGLVSRQVSTLSSQCAAQYARVDAADPAGIKAATQAGTAMSAAAGQCAEARAQLNAAYQNAMATAALRRADREAMYEAADHRDLMANIRAGCAAIPSAWECQRAQQTQQSPPQQPAPTQVPRS